MEQRVAITGIGAVSPLGNTALATWAAMCAGTCGIGPITHFDTDAFTVKVAACLLYTSDAADERK